MDLLDEWQAQREFRETIMPMSHGIDVVHDLVDITSCITRVAVFCFQGEHILESALGSFDLQLRTASCSQAASGTAA